MLTMSVFAASKIEYSGNFTANFKKAFQGISEVSENHKEYTLPLPGTKIAVWAHMGGYSGKALNPEEVEKLRNFVKDGGILVLYASTPTNAFPKGKNQFDLSPAIPVLGAKAYAYGNWKSTVQPKGTEIFGSAAEKYNIFAGQARRPGLGKLDGLAVLFGTTDTADLGVMRIGKGAVIYTGTDPKDPVYAEALAKLVTILLDEKELDRLFPLQKSNEAVLMDGKKLHLAMAAGGQKTILPEILAQSLGKESFTPVEDMDQVLIHVGETPYVKSLGLDFQSLHPFGYYMICRDGRNIVLAGKNRTGTNFAVNDFLKRFAGYRAYPGGKLYEIIPKQDALKLPAKFEFREEPSVKSYNLVFTSNGDFARNPRLTCMATHALSELVPPVKYGKTHPEYFPLIGGKRRLPDEKGKFAGPWNPCMSHGDLEKLVEEYADEYFKKHPDNFGLPLGVNDGGGDCQCEKCVAELNSTGNQYARFYNLAARVLAKKYPGKAVSFIAYGRTASAVPRGIKMENNILVEVINWGSVNAYERMEQWKKIGVRHFGLYDYIYSAGAGYVTPRYFPHTIGNAWKENHKKYSIETMWLEFYPSSYVFESPRQYVFDELAWNMNADIDALLKDYFRNVYAEAAEPMEKFFNRLEEVYSRKPDALVPMNDWKRPKQMKEFTFEDLEKLDAFLAEAKKRVKDPDAAKRLTLLEKYYGLTRLHIENSICSNELAKIEKVASDSDCRKIVELVKRGYAAAAGAEHYAMTPEEEKHIFLPGGYTKDNSLARWKKMSTLHPTALLEVNVDPALGKVTEYLKAKGKNIAEFYAKAAEDAGQEAARAAFLTQSYVQTNREEQNIVRNPSFEEVSGKHESLAASDHTPFQASFWSTWCFPSSVTRFFVNKEIAHSGKQSGAIGELQIAGSIISYVKLEPKCRYRLSFWVRRNRGDEGFGCGQLGIRFQGKSGWLDQGSAVSVVYPPECENKWVRLETSFTAPDEPATALLLFGAPRQAEGVWTAFDDVSLVKIFDPTQLDVKKK